MRILLDFGHGKNTPGKRSFDNSFFEYKFNREIGNAVAAQLAVKNLPHSIIVTEEIDIPLVDRCKRINELCALYGKENCLLLSIHANAFGETWNSAHGWSIYTTPGVTESDHAALYFYNAAKQLFGKENVRAFNGDNEPDYEENLYILRHSACPAILTENFFYTNRDDLEKFLLSPFGRKQIVNLHVNALTYYISEKIG